MIESKKRETANRRNSAYEKEKYIMQINRTSFGPIDEYILQFPPEVQEILKSLRKAIKESAPDAEERISYQMPTFVLHGNLVH